MASCSPSSRSPSSRSPSSSSPPMFFQPSFLRIPTEISERILTMSDPLAVAAMAQSCTFFRDLINRPTDQHLWRSLYLVRFDDPRTTFVLYGGDPSKYPWSSVLQQRTRSEILLKRRGGFQSLTPEEQCVALGNLIDAIYYSPPPYALTYPSQDIEWAKRLIDSNDLFQPSSNQDVQEMISKLHVYYGLSREEKRVPGAQAKRTASRSFVYDLRKYHKANLWGPFLPNSTGCVSWVHVEHVIYVISMNLEDIVDLWEEMRPPTGLRAIRPYSAPEAGRTPQDWAGVTGKWYRYVCFMDYRDLFAFNYSTSTGSDTEPLNTDIFEDEQFQEAIRLIELNLRVIDYMPSNNPYRPTIRFEGNSKGAQGNEARVRGTVRMTPDGQIRWKFISMYDGRTQWNSEGIQIGGPASAMGVVGTWTGTHHTERDPVGPFWLWKVDKQ